MKVHIIKNQKLGYSIYSPELDTISGNYATYEDAAKVCGWEHYEILNARQEPLTYCEHCGSNSPADVRCTNACRDPQPDIKLTDGPVPVETLRYHADRNVSNARQTLIYVEDALKNKRGFELSIKDNRFVIVFASNAWTPKKIKLAHASKGVH